MRHHTQPTQIKSRVARLHVGKVALVSVVLAFALPVSGAAAVSPPPLLVQIGEHSSPAAGQFQNPRAVAVSPNGRRVYVSENLNSRVSVFSPWGQFIEAFGWGVKDGAAKLESCTATSGCQKGLAGGGDGELNEPRGVAVDSAGDVYVAEQPNHRVEKFSRSGEFIAMFGGEVDKTSGANLCTKASGDVCGIGVTGTGNGEFEEWTVGNFIAIGAGDTVYVGDQNRIQVFDSGGSYKSNFPDPGGVLAGKSVHALAIDPGGDLLVAFAGKEDVVKLDPAGTKLCTMAAQVPLALASDGEGDVYAIDDPPGFGVPKLEPIVREFGPECDPVAEFGRSPIELTGPNGLGTNSVGDVYVASFNGSEGNDISYVSVYGPPPVALEPPPPAPPAVGSEYATAVGTDAASVQAEINPHFWEDTTYSVQYGSADCSSNPCTQTPASPAKLNPGPVAAFVKSGGVLLAGLSPGTTYHYRFEVESSGGGPVYGPDRTFTTPPPRVGPKVDCPNQAFRIGPSASLPDCRAYEMVSPLDKENGDTLALGNQFDYPTRLDRSATSGDRFTYSSYRAFAGAASQPFSSQYLATRDPGAGWLSEAISPPGGLSKLKLGYSLEIQYRAFSDDLCEAWLFDPYSPVIAPGAVEGVPNLYRRDNCGGGTFEALTTVAPPHEEEYRPELQDVAGDGSCTVFRAEDSLTPEAPYLPFSGAGGAEFVLYESCGGQLHLLSVLPNGEPYAASGSSAGSGVPAFFEGGNYNDRLFRAVSDDGSKVYWTASAGGPGRLYLRTNAQQPQSKVASGKCTEAAKACTFAVSPPGASAEFQLADPTGAKALFIQDEGGGDQALYEYDFQRKKVTRIAGGVVAPAPSGGRGLLGASEDLSRIYFASTEALASGAQAGSPNLYLDEGGVLTFVAALSARDVQTLPSPVSDYPVEHTATVSPDGLHVAFMSSASLTGYDNTDALSGEADAEVYRYDAPPAGGQLVCISCDASGARPSGREAGGPQDGGSPKYWAAARIPTWQNDLFDPRSLSADGSRLFFESFAPLVSRDTNGVGDVYEWERAGGEEACEEAGAELYVASSGGCISLISSGESPRASLLLDASPDGRDVFIATLSSLVPQDSGLVDVYDARVGGGFAPPLSGS